MAIKDNRDRLEDAAQDSVQLSGFNSLSFRKLADEVGIKSSSVHYHFPEKSDLAHALIVRYSAAVSETLNDIANQRWGLRRKLQAYIAIFEQTAKSERVCLCGMMAAEIEALNDDSRKQLDLFFKMMEQWLVDLLVANGDALNTDVTPAVLSSAILSGLEGALLLDRVSGNQSHLNAQKDLILSLV